MKRHILNGGKTTADINCETFDETLLEPKKRPQKRNIIIKPISPHKWTSKYHYALIE